MSDKPATNDLVLVKLRDEQRVPAKQANPHRRKITHALLCGAYGQMLGTEKHCAKYYHVWKEIFRRLFDKVYETETLHQANQQVHGSARHPTAHLRGNLCHDTGIHRASSRALAPGSPKQRALVA
jgi:hypothetical protein